MMNVCVYKMSLLSIRGFPSFSYTHLPGALCPAARLSVYMFMLLLFSDFYLSVENCAIYVSLPTYLPIHMRIYMYT